MVHVVLTALFPSEYWKGKELGLVSRAPQQKRNASAVQLEMPCGVVTANISLGVRSFGTNVGKYECLQILDTAVVCVFMENFIGQWTLYVDLVLFR